VPEEAYQQGGYYAQLIQTWQEGLSGSVGSAKVLISGPPVKTVESHKKAPLQNGNVCSGTFFKEFSV
jgi:hypothetical protein